MQQPNTTKSIEEEQLSSQECNYHANQSRPSFSLLQMWEIMMSFWKMIEVLYHFGFSLQENLSKSFENE